MFTTEQQISTRGTKWSEKRLFRSGMVLAKPVRVTRRFTYREMTLILGVCVALIVALTLWTSKKNISLLPENTSASVVVETPVQEIVMRSIAYITSIRLF